MNCGCIYCSCTLQSECSDAGDANHWKSRVTGTYNSCVNITNLQPASHWPVQRSVNVRQFYDRKPMRSIILHKKIPDGPVNSRRFPGFPGGFLNSGRFPGVVDTLLFVTLQPLNGSCNGSSDGSSSSCNSFQSSL